MGNKETASKASEMLDAHLKSLSDPIKRHALLAAHQAVAKLLGLDERQIKVSGLRFAVEGDDKLESHFFQKTFDCTCHTPDGRCCGFGVLPPE
jgi:hypothetical protein